MEAGQFSEFGLEIRIKNCGTAIGKFITNS